MKQLFYFGTDLGNYGHYFFKLEEGRMYNQQKMSLPFDIDGIFSYSDKGDVFFGHINGWTILAIDGSCTDGRPGTKTIFFTESILTASEMKEYVLSVPIAAKILSQMESKKIIIKWPDFSKENRAKYMEETIRFQNEYIQLLEDEIKDIVSYAVSHGWISQRYEQGVILREEIQTRKQDGGIQ